MTVVTLLALHGFLLLGTPSLEDTGPSEEPQHERAEAPPGATVDGDEEDDGDERPPVATPPQRRRGTPKGAPDVGFTERVKEGAARGALTVAILAVPTLGLGVALSGLAGGLALVSLASGGLVWLSTLGGMVFLGVFAGLGVALALVAVPVFAVVGWLAAGQAASRASQQGATGNPHTTSHLTRLLQAAIPHQVAAGLGTLVVCGSALLAAMITVAGLGVMGVGRAFNAPGNTAVMVNNGAWLFVWGWVLAMAPWLVLMPLAHGAALLLQLVGLGASGVTTAVSGAMDLEPAETDVGP